MKFLSGAKGRVLYERERKKREQEKLDLKKEER